MPSSKNRKFARIAALLNNNGKLTTDTLATTVTESLGGLDSAAVSNIVTSVGVTTGKSIAMSIVFGD